VTVGSKGGVALEHARRHVELDLALIRLRCTAETRAGT
jgi:hypothetical protein